MLRIKGHEVQKESQYPQHKLGEGADTVDGRVFRYGWAGESITISHLATAGVIDTALASQVVITGAKGDKHIDFTSGATTTTANYFDQGFAGISAGTGRGQNFKIANLPALSSSATSIVHLEDPIVTALATDSRLDIVQNPYAQCLMTATETLTPVGVPMLTVTTQYYAWFQTRGVAVLASDTTIAAGTGFHNDDSVAGEVEAVTEADLVIDVTAGHAYQNAGAQDISHHVFLTIE